MELQPNRPTNEGPAAWFTGQVWMDTIHEPQPPSLLTVYNVHFHPGSRTAWHTHSNGQTLYVTEGRGLAQSRGEPIIEIRPGDIVTTPASEWHWHGATPEHFMTHLSITDGDATFGDHVTDLEYLATPPD